MSNDNADNNADDESGGEKDAIDATDVEAYRPDLAAQTVSATADAAFALDFSIDNDSYLNDELFRCPNHDTVLPVALPYVTEELPNSPHEPDGFHLVCPRCRFTFAEYSVSDQQWRDR